MNPLLGRLQPYPFEKLRALLAAVAPPASLRPINLSIGEPKHPTPALVRQALAAALDGLSGYPATAGTPALREAIAGWISRRYGVAAPDAATQVLPINGSREALFAFAQTVIDPSRGDARVACPNPFYQIYEGAALLAGARPVYLNDGAPLESINWDGVQLAYVCSPANPTGRVLGLEAWRRLFELSDRHGFVIASDECYSELYFDELRPPLGALQAAHRLGREGYPRLVVFSSLSKRSNAPGMRSGFVAGEAALLRAFLLYRTYHGSRDEPAGAAGLDRRLGRRGARAREPAAVRGKVPRSAAADRGAAATPRCPRAASTCGCAPRSTTPTSPASCSVNIMCWCCRAASWRATRRAPIRAGITCDSRWSRPSPSAWRPRSASANSFADSRRPMQAAQKIIDQAWEARAALTPASASRELREAVDAALDGLDAGTLRVAEKVGGEWITHQWLKKAVLLSFRMEDNRVLPGGATQYYDKVPGKFAAYDAEAFAARRIPRRAARDGAPGLLPRRRTSC